MGVAHEDVLSLLHYEQAFDLKDADVCADVSLIYQSGRGAAQAFAKALDLIQKTCGDSSLPGCINLDQSYENGWGVLADIDRARGHRSVTLV